MIPPRNDSGTTLVDRIAAFDAAVDRRFDVIRTPQIDKVAYRLSSAADHSLLWHMCGVARALAHGDDARLGRAVLARDGRGVGDHERSGEVALPAGAARRSTTSLAFLHGLRRPITSSFPSGHATAAFCAATLLDGGPVGYVAATAVAATRIYVRLHHASDVVAGAAFGLVLGRVMRPLVNRPT